VVGVFFVLQPILIMSLEQYIRDIPDFPKNGIIFKDITPLLGSEVATALCLDQLLRFVEGQHIDKVVGMESRGFLFGMLLAQKLGAGFVPIRKSGKLPFHTYQQSYALEYGNDVLEIHTDAIQKGERVLIHDDVLATGGTAAAACKLVEKCGGEIVQCNFIMELAFLKGAKKVAYPVKAALSY